MDKPVNQVADKVESQRIIAFSPPDITQSEIDRVIQVLKSGWITTGPVTAELEQRLQEFTGTAGLSCVNSATAALECLLRILGIGPGDEVIAPAYTYTATISPICHVGATPVLVDVAPDSVAINRSILSRALTSRTKAVIGVDIGGVMEDYEGLRFTIEAAGVPFEPAHPLQEAFGRPIIIADGAHSLGAMRNGVASGCAADFTVFSFHAVKNFTTAEGGALCWKPDSPIDSDEMYRQVRLQSLHGQTKDALAKTKAGGWEYDIAFPGYKCNMTDIQAGLGLAQLERYPGLLARRRQLIERYERNLATAPVQLLGHYSSDGSLVSSGHLMITRVEGASSYQRNAIIESLAARGVAANVHYKPLPLLTAYRNLGFSVHDFPYAMAFFENEITLPLHTLLSDDDVDYVCSAYTEAIGECLA